MHFDHPANGVPRWPGKTRSHSCSGVWLFWQDIARRCRQRHQMGLTVLGPVGRDGPRPPIGRDFRPRDTGYLLPTLACQDEKANKRAEYVGIGCSAARQIATSSSSVSTRSRASGLEIVQWHRGERVGLYQLVLDRPRIACSPIGGRPAGDGVALDAIAPASGGAFSGFLSARSARMTPAWSSSSAGRFQAPPNAVCSARTASSAYRWRLPDRCSRCHSSTSTRSVKRSRSAWALAAAIRARRSCLGSRPSCLNWWRTFAACSRAHFNPCRSVQSPRTNLRQTPAPSAETCSRSIHFRRPVLGTRRNRPGVAPSAMSSRPAGGGAIFRGSVR